VSTGLDWTIALDAGGKVHTWGANTNGQLGDNSTNPRFEPASLSHAGSLAGRTVVAVSAGRWTALALDTGGCVHAWGLNNSGQLGDGTTVSKSNPVSLSNAGSLQQRNITAIATSVFNAQVSAAVDSAGVVHAWGENNVGQMAGASPFFANSNPLSLADRGSLSNAVVRSVVVGGSHLVALDTDGAVHTWGWGASGQLGIDSAPGSATPQSIANNGSLVNQHVTAVRAGWQHTLALDTLGRLHAWGLNSTGQLGDGTTITRSNPVLVGQDPTSSLYGVTTHQMGCGSMYSFSMDSNGAVHAWGSNMTSQLGANGVGVWSNAVLLLQN
jgi:alpha-tubulin suppressor-like RCC1 family protein